MLTRTGLAVMAAVAALFMQTGPTRAAPFLLIDTPLSVIVGERFDVALRFAGPSSAADWLLDYPGALLEQVDPLNIAVLPDPSSPATELETVPLDAAMPLGFFYVASPLDYATLLPDMMAGTGRYGGGVPTEPLMAADGEIVFTLSFLARAAGEAVLTLGYAVWHEPFPGDPVVLDGKASVTLILLARTDPEPPATGVPAPAGAALLAAGLLGLGVVRKPRRG